MSRTTVARIALLAATTIALTVVPAAAAQAQQGAPNDYASQGVSDVKFIDKATPDLMLSGCNEKHYDKATLAVRKAAEQPLEYLTVTMEELLASGYANKSS